jgi:uncharacterized membrane protein
MQVQVRLGCNDVDAEFLGEFTAQRIGSTLTIGDLAARELPKSVKRAVTQSFGNQDTTGAISQNASCDMKVVH